MSPEALLRAHVRSAPAYTPILPFDVLSEQLGLPAGQIIKLDANENPYGVPQAVLQALSRVRFGHVYPDPESRRLRAALARANDIPVENILVGAGADELIDLVMRLFLEPGDVVLNAPPTFGMYAFDAGVNAAQVYSIPRRTDFSLDLDAIEQAARESQAKLLFLASPNNPDGSLLNREELMRLLELPLVIVLDEAYIEFADRAATSFRVVLERSNLVVLRTFSKWAGLAGFRVGYGVFPDWMMPYLWKIKQPYNVSVAAQVAAETALRTAGELDAIGRAIISERSRLMECLQNISWLSPYPSQANFVLCRVQERSARAVKNALAEAGVIIRYFDAPGLQDHIRISVGRPQDTDRLVEVMQSI